MQLALGQSLEVRLGHEVITGIAVFDKTWYYVQDTSHPNPLTVKEENIISTITIYLIFMEDSQNDNALFHFRLSRKYLSSRPRQEARKDTRL